MKPNIKIINIKTILIILFVSIILIPIIFKLVGYNYKVEGICNKNCDISGDCFGTDMSNCLILNSAKCPEPVAADPIKCIADFGTDIGDPLCCGADGVLQNTKYVCPSNLKTCRNFKCGSAFGNCVADS